MQNHHEAEFYFQGPDFDFEFASNDALIFNLYSYRILVFKIDSHQSHVKSTDMLKKALQKVVGRCPPLGGRVIPLETSPDGQEGWKKVVPGPGIKLVVRDLRAKLNYADLEANNFPTEAFKCDEVVPISPLPSMEGEAPGSVFQYTWIEGGALLTIGIDHPITDGNGMNLITGILADECRQAQSSSCTLENKIPHDSAVRLLGIDRSCLRSLESSIKNSPEYHSSYVFLDEPPVPEDHHDDSGPELHMYMFKIVPEKLVELKKLASPDNYQISTHDALCAITWRNTMLSRYAAGTIKDLDAEVEFHLPTDCRRFLGLDTNYVGNVVYFIACSMPLRELLRPDSLPKAATLIREQLSARDADLVGGYFSLVKSLPHLSQMSFGWLPKMTTTACGIGSSWKANEMYGADWGDEFGPVKRFRSPDVGFFGSFKGIAFVCPRIHGTGSAEIQMWFEPEGLNALQEDELFTRFFERI
jgi:hypothetical protein